MLFRAHLSPHLGLVDATCNGYRGQLRNGSKVTYSRHDVGSDRCPPPPQYGYLRIREARCRRRSMQSDTGENRAECLGPRGYAIRIHRATGKVIVDRSAIAKKAARTRKLRRAGKKAALTRKRRAAGRKAAATRKRRAAAKKAVATRRAEVGNLISPD